MAVDFHMGLSEQTVKLRYMYNFPLEERITHERLAALTFIDYDREIALVAIDENGDESRMVGVGRLEMMSGTKEVAEFGILVADDYQRQGLGSALLSRLLSIGKQEGVERVFGKLLVKNRDSVEFLHNFGFTTFPLEDEDGILMGTLSLARLTTCIARLLQSGVAHRAAPQPQGRATNLWKSTANGLL